MVKKKKNRPELEFFNSISGTLEIEMNLPPTRRFKNLANLFSPSEAKIISLKLQWEIFNHEQDDFRDLTPEELDSIAFNEPQIKLRSLSDEIVLHHAPNGKFFTVRDLLLAVEETERKTRGQSNWYDGIDIHHIYFEGIESGARDVWDIGWGS